VWLPELEQRAIPVQLFESAGLLGLFLVLRSMQTPARLAQPGRLFGAYLVGYGLLRWLLEWWRADQPVLWPGITVQQWISLGLIGIGAILLVSRTGPAHSTQHTAHSSGR